MRLENKIALVAGAGGNLGSEIVRKFVGEGAQVVLHDINQEILDKAVTTLDEKLRARTRTYVADITKYEDMIDVAKYVVKEFGRIDILVNMAGILIQRPIQIMTIEEWHKVMDVNLNGAFYLLKAVVPYMMEQKYGKIINTSSLAARTARRGVGVNYSASKAGVIGMCKTLAGDLGPYNINVNVIAPGPIDSPMFHSQTEENQKILRSGFKIDRLGKPEDIAYCALYLASDESSWITGQVLDVSGGIIM